MYRNSLFSLAYERISASASCSPAGGGRSFSSCNRILLGTALSMRSSREVHPTVSNMWETSRSSGPLWRRKNPSVVANAPLPLSVPVDMHRRASERELLVADWRWLLTRVTLPGFRRTPAWRAAFATWKNTDMAGRVCFPSSERQSKPNTATANDALKQRVRRTVPNEIAPISRVTYIFLSCNERQEVTATKTHNNFSVLATKTKPKRASAPAATTGCHSAALANRSCKLFKLPVPILVPIPPSVRTGHEKCHAMDGMGGQWK